MKDSQDQEHFDQWALVELMGHQKIAGRVIQTQIAGQGMLRVEVPDKAGNTRFTRFYSPSAVYCISPVDKQIAIGLAIKMETEPVHRYQLAQFADTKEHTTVDQEEFE